MSTASPSSARPGTEVAPVFLVGAQRSGTTALAHALSRAFAAAGGQFTVNGKLPYLLRRWWTQEDLRRQHLRADEVQHGLWRLAAGGVDAEAWLQRASQSVEAGARRGADGQITGRVEDEVRRICAEAYGVPLWGDKYNEYLLDLGWLDTVFPAARWIFIAREPGDVVRSMLAWRAEKVWNPHDVDAAAAKWASWNGAWLHFRSSLDDGRRWEIGYDQLPGPAARSLSAWLGIDVEPFLTDFSARGTGADLDGLPESARAVRRELARLGILAGGEDRAPAASASPRFNGGSTSLTHLHHVLVAMPRGEEERARRFYGELLGLTEVPKPPVLAQRGGVWFRSESVEFHVGVEDEFRPARVAHPAFGARALGDLATWLEAGDVDVRWDPNYPGHRRFYVHDPFGNRLEFLERIDET